MWFLFYLYAGFFYFRNPVKITSRILNLESTSRIKLSSRFPSVESSVSWAPEKRKYDFSIQVSLYFYLFNVQQSTRNNMKGCVILVRKCFVKYHDFILLFFYSTYCRVLCYRFVLSSIRFVYPSCQKFRPKKYIVFTRSTLKVLTKSVIMDLVSCFIRLLFGAFCYCVKSTFALRCCSDRWHTDVRIPALKHHVEAHMLSKCADIIQENLQILPWDFRKQSR